jgi:preprotein translocase subunit YajC
MRSLESIAELKKDGLDGIIDNVDDRKAIINAAKRKVKVTFQKAKWH